MKPALLITLSFLLFFAFTTKQPLAFSDDNKILLATDGEPITTGEVIYIFPGYPPSNESSEGGGLILGQTDNSTCPLTVLQHFSSDFNGLPVLLTNPKNSNTSSHHNATRSTSLDIQFVHKPINCAKSFKWVVVVDDDDGGDCPFPWVGVGDDQDYPSGKKILSGRFHIHRAFNGRYKLVFCPASSTRGGCKHIGRHQDMHGKRLILTDKDPFQVEFIRSHDIL